MRHIGLSISILLVFASLMTAVFAATGDPIGCCVSSTIACTDIFTSEEATVCDASGDQFVAGEFCEDISACSGATQGCCCFPDGLQVNPSAQRDLCLNTIQGHFTIQPSVSECLSYCGNLGGSGGQPPQGETCLEQNGFWCDSGDSSGAVISDPSDQNDHPGQVCYTAPCGTSTNTCLQLGGTVCSPGQACANWLDESTQCCIGSCSSPTCESLGGFYCAQDQSCAGTSLTGQVIDFAGQSHPNSLCCSGNSPADACFDGNSCDATSSFENFCNDGVDNDCDDYIDLNDGDCGATISGIIIDGVTGFPITSGIIVRATNDNGDVATTISLGDGTYTIYSIADGEHDVELISDDYNAETKFDIPVVRNEEVTGIDFVVGSVSSGSFFGNVLDENGVGVEGATVLIMNSPYLTISQSGGFFQFVSLPTDETLQAFAFKLNYEKSDVYSFTVRDDDSIEHDFVLTSFDCALETPAPIITTASPVRGYPQINLAWSISGCDTELENVHVERCTGDEIACLTNGTYQRIGILSIQDEQVYTDNVQWNAYYTYRIVAEYANSEAVSEVVTIFSGDQNCANHVNDSQFCISDGQTSGGFYCDENNLVIPATNEITGEVVSCTPGETCSQFLSSVNTVQTICLETIACAADPRAAPFGLYFTEEICQFDEQGNRKACYLESYQSSVDTCLNCNPGMSCADYTSRSSCEANFCGVINDGIPGDCVWQDLNVELSIGVCVDSTVDLCDACLGDSVFDTCTRDKCEALGEYGDGCYYGESFGGAVVCENCEATTCYDYQEESSCDGGIDVRLSTFDNSLITQSSDQCSIGVCRWQGAGISGGTCFKDANVDGLDDCYNHDKSGTICRSDRTQPVSLVVMSDNINPEGENVTINFVVSDPEWQYLTSPVREVRFCIEPLGSGECHSTAVDYDRAFVDSTGIHSITLSGSQVTPGVEGKTYTLVPGMNTIKYYSVDWAYNIELVHEFNFSFDQSAPDISIEYFILPYTPELGQVQRSDVVLIATLDEPGLCILNLEGCDETGTCQEFSSDEDLLSNQDAFLAEHQRIIHNVEDGIYTAVVSCIDPLGNIGTETQEIIVDADPRASNPQPHGPIDFIDVTISVDTTDAVSCKWTTDINDAYDDIGVDQIMERSNAGNRYVHTYDITLPTSQSYTYYAVCNYDPISKERISFAVDQLAPELELQNAQGDPYDFGSWQTTGLIFPVCTDDPDGGFGCEQIRYCTTVYEPGVLESEKESCVPDVIVNGSILLENPQRICVVAQEETVSGMGGKNSSQYCGDVLVDPYAPFISVSSFPGTTNTNFLEISGSISDVHYLATSWSAGDVGSTQYQAFVEDESTLYMRDFNFYADLGITYTEEVHPVVGVQFRYSDAGAPRYYNAIVDASIPGAFELRLERVVPGGQEVLGSVPINFAADVVYPLSIQTDGADIEFSYAGEVLVVEDTLGLGDVTGGQFGMQVFRDGESFPTVVLSNIMIHDKSIATENTLFVKKDEHIEQTILTTDAFNTLLQLSGATLFHGDAYLVTLDGRDLAGRSSNTISKTVYYDVQGPIVSNISFRGVDQIDTSYVEYQTDAEVYLDINDDFGYVGEVVITVDDQQLSGVKNDSSLFGIFPTSQLIIGKHDVQVYAVDEAGNPTTVEFENALFIDDRINPRIIFNFDTPFRTYGLNPQFSINTTEPTTCTISYEDGTGVEREINFDNPNNVEHAATLIYDLPYVGGEEVTVEAVVSCEDGGGNIDQKMFDIVVDRRSPLIGVKANDYDLILKEYNRTSKSYQVITDTRRQLRVVSDEKVQCRYGALDDDFINLPIAMKNTQFDVYNFADSSDEFFIGSGESVFFVKCQDVVGNEVTRSHRVLFDTNRNSPAIIVNATPNGFTNDDSVVFNVHTMRDLSCSGALNTVNDEGIVFTKLPGVPVQFRSQSFDLADGAYQYTITCGASSLDVQTTSEQYGFTVDTVAPIVTIAPPVEESSAPRISISGTVSELSEVRVYNDDLHWQEQVSSTFTADVPLRFGLNEIRVLAEDQAGNIGEYSFTVSKRSQDNEIRIGNFLHGSTQRELHQIEVDIIEDLSVNDIQIELLDEQGGPVAGTVSNGLDQASFIVDAQLSDGVYYIRASAFNGADQLVAYDSAVVQIDAYAEVIDVVEPSDVSITTNPLALLGKVDYQSVIVDQLMLFSSGAASITRIYEVFEGEFDLEQGANEFTLRFRNEIGHNTELKSIFDLDSAGPEAFVTIKGGGEVTFGAKPSFEAFFSEPARILEAYVVPIDSEQQILMEQDYGSTTFYLERDFVLADSLPLPGTYQVGLRLADKSGIETSRYYLTFEFTDNPIGVELISPSHGVSENATFDFTILTDRSSICRYDSQNSSYDQMQFFATSNGSLHSVELSLGQENTVFTYFVKCDAGGINEDSPYVFDLSYDTSKPVIEDVFVSPSDGGVIVEYPLQTNIVALTDDVTHCRYTDADTLVFEEMFLFDLYDDFFTNGSVRLGNLEDQTTYEYSVICENRAGLLSQPRTVDFSVDLSAAPTIKILTPAPGGYYNNLSLPIEVQTNKRALDDSCTWGNVSGQVTNSFDRHENDDKLHIVDSFAFGEGEHTVYIRCLIESGVFEQSATFVVDTTAPICHNIIDNVFSYRTSQLSAEFNFSDDESGIEFYEYAIGRKIVNGINPAEDWQSEVNITLTDDDDVTEKDLNLTNLQNYYWAVRATNKAGLTSAWCPSDGVTVDTSKQPTGGSCSDGLLNQDETGIDCGGLRCAACTDNNACLSDSDCIGSCVDNICQSQGCTNGVLDGDETDVDCGGSVCGGCSAGGVCSVNTDCSSNYCAGSVCQEALCDDGLKNGFEADIDCGGSCERCLDGSSCTNDVDCQSGVCESNICIASSCEDGLLNGLETDIDCGGGCALCVVGQLCEEDADCFSNYCQDGACGDEDDKDTDGDGMPDWYEDEYGLDATYAGDAQEDKNGDGMLNIEKYDYRFNEYNLRQVPLDPGSDDFDGDGSLDIIEIQKLTDATDANDFPQAQFFSIILFLIAFILVGGVLGYFVYTRGRAQQKPEKPIPASVVAPRVNPTIPRQARPPTPRMSMRDKLKHALKSKILEERRGVLEKEHSKIFDSFGEGKSSAKKGDKSTDAGVTKKALKLSKVPKAPKPPVKKEESTHLDKLKSLNKKPEKQSAKGSLDKLKSLDEKIDQVEDELEGKDSKTKSQQKVLDKLKKIKNGN